ncbi:SDR family oxidoreductase [Nocardioides marmorisolisilvae]|uniref:SDR family oxidoreductase n=1 Tax=Nocardioides marmorisolisilvae TaxID=1542737 RepID=A0A3N0DZ51_9ACTN|nr:SDR family oxidoreductase [Nocardioides marmorisolisilvae]RNL80879.1 SDR family oxidoreductase [Nocardioides marmorisolisilvae]
MSTQKTIVITGASDGIGLESASQLAAQGHHLVMVGRNPAKLAAAVERVRTETPTVVVESFVCDFSVLADVRRLANDLLAAYPRIDVLVNNAGTVYDKRTLTADGYEATFAVNHLASFLLTELLLDRIIASGSARIVTTSSVGHYRGTMDFDDLGFERGYQIMRAYSRSKLANVLYTRSLTPRLAGTGVTANCLHPGAVATNIWDGAPAIAKPVLAIAKRLFMVSPAEGGATLTYLATNAEVEGRSGGYYEKNRIKEPAELAQDDAVAQRLVEVSRKLVGL